MREKIKQFWGKKNNLIVVVLVGVLLLVIAIPVGDGGSEKKEVQQESDSIKNAQGDGSVYQDSQVQEYCSYMEEKLAAALSRMEGAGKVQVIISMKSSEEKVVEKDRPVSRSGTKETDSQGGTREVSTVDSEESTVFASENGTSQPYVVKVLQPQVEGVLVLAQGAGTGSVSRNISAAIQVLFDIDAHKIRVVKMETP